MKKKKNKIVKHKIERRWKRMNNEKPKMKIVCGKYSKKWSIFQLRIEFGTKPKQKKIKVHEKYIKKKHKRRE